MIDLIDTHTHITSDRLYEDKEGIVQRAKEHHVKRMMVVCTNFIEYERAIALQDEEVIFDVALGFHPSDLLRFEEKDYLRLEEICKSGNLKALGEIGLDYHWKEVEPSMQKESFIRQLQLANTYELPVLIHMRDATADTLAILNEHAKTNFVMHCFSGSKETAQVVMRMGGYLSFAGPITFKNARGLTEVPQVCDIHKIFVETDCPYLTPHPHRGKSNEPMYVQYTFETVCALLEKDKETMASIMKENYEVFLNI